MNDKGQAIREGLILYSSLFALEAEVGIDSQSKLIEVSKMERHEHVMMGRELDGKKGRLTDFQDTQIANY